MTSTGLRDRAAELLPCPFCGAQPVVWSDGEDWIAACVGVATCHAEPGCVLNKTRDEAIRKWNTRATPAPALVERAPDDRLFNEVESIIAGLLMLLRAVYSGDDYGQLRIRVQDLLKESRAILAALPGAATEVLKCEWPNCGCPTAAHCTATEERP